jgi:hypothetical protein
MSDRALAYSNEPLSHRFLIIYEATGLSSDLASYLVRSLLSEGRIRYETVEKTSEGMQPILIEREGPTGLIITTTRIRLHPENETRLISITMSDTPEQTRAVLQYLANEEDVPDLTTWQALQTWLTAGEHKVVIPYATALADMVPPVAVRLRRDFSGVLSLIKANALLHRASRERDKLGRIIASLGDYAVVRELASEFISENVGLLVGKTVREAVEAVEELKVWNKDGDITVKMVAKELDLDKSAASRRVRKALDHGYLINKEERKGKALKLDLGDPLPEERNLLPPVEELEERLHGCILENGSTTDIATEEMRKNQ